MVEGWPNVRAEQFSRQLQLQLCDALDRSHGPGQGVIGREARAALQRWPISIYWLGLERWGSRWQVGSIPDPIRGLIETTVDGQSTVVEYEPDPVLRDTEQVPLLGEGGVEAFFGREVLPYAPDAWYVPDSVKIGYEISFTRHFYKPQPLRPLEEIRANILVLERETEGLMTVGNQRKWDTLRPERLEIGRGLGELPEGLVVAPSPFDCVSLHLLPALQYPFPPPVEHICGCHIAQRLVIAPVVVVGHEGGKGSLQIGSHLVGDLLDVSLDSLVLALQLAVGLRVEGCSPDVLDSHQAQVVSEATGHIS